MKHHIIVSIFYGIFLCVMSNYFLSHRYYNWDIEGYMGLIYQQTNPKMGIEEIHEKVYREIKKNAPEKFNFTPVPEETLGSSDYYKTLSQNPKAYGELLDLFSVKPAYSFANRIFYEMGTSPLKATDYTSVFSYFAIGIFLFLILRHLLPNPYLVLVFSVLLMLFKPIVEATKHASPDVFSVFWLVCTFYIFYRKSFWWATVFAIITVLSRPDFVIIFVLFFGWLFISRKKLGLKLSHLLLPLVGVLLSFAWTQTQTHVSWKTLVSNQFIKPQLYPVSAPNAFSFVDYFKYIQSKLFFEINTSYFPLLAIVVLMLLWKLKQQNLVRFKHYSVYFSLIYLSVAVRFCFFPALSNRMMLGYYLLILLGLLFMVFKEYKTTTK